MWILAAFVFMVGVLLTANDLRKDIALHDCVTLNVPLTLLMHTLLGLPFLITFLFVSLIKFMIGSFNDI